MLLLKATENGPIVIPKGQIVERGKPNKKSSGFHRRIFLFQII